MNNSNYNDSEADSYDLEDMVYEEFPGATCQGGATYDKQHFLNLFEISHSSESPEYSGNTDDIETLLLEDPAGKALYSLIECNEDTVEFDIKIFGDASGVERYIDSLPAEGYVEGVESVKGSSNRSALARLDEEQHPLNLETDTDLSEPGNTPDNGFTNSQAERIKREVLEEDSI